jgi:hypothetical protein
VFDFLIKILKDLSGAVTQGASWVWNNMVPQSVKNKFSFGQISFAGMFGAIFSLLRSVYFYMIIASVVVVYYLYIALYNAGFIYAFKSLLFSAMHSIFYIAQTCFQEIGSGVGAVYRCIEGAPAISTAPSPDELQASLSLPPPPDKF